MALLAQNVANLPDDPFWAIPQNSDIETKPINDAISFANIGANIMIGVVIAVSVIMIVASGITYITSRGDVKATMKAQQSLFYAIVALVGGVSAITFKNLLLDLFGATEPQLP